MNGSVSVTDLTSGSIRYIRAVNMVEAKIQDPRTLERARSKPGAFTRKSSFGYDDLVHCQISAQRGMTNYSMMVDYCVKAHGRTPGVSSSLYSEKRGLVDCHPWYATFNATVDAALADERSTFRGYTIVDVDGSCYMMNKGKDSGEAREVFGEEGTYPTLLMMLYYLPRDEFYVDIRPHPIKTGERDALIDNLGYLKWRLGEDDDPLITGDRGYPSYEVFEAVAEEGMHFLFRCPEKSTFKEVEEAPMGTSTQVLKNGMSIQVHKFKISEDTVEVLVTNAFDLSGKDMEEIYWMRWDEEVSIDTTKHKVGMAKFTGQTVNTVLQDIFAAATMANLALAFARKSDELIEKEPKGENRKHKTYRTKRSEVVGSLHRHLPKMMSLRASGEKMKIAQLILEECIINRVPVRKGRKFPRKMPKQKRQYPFNRRVT